MTLVGPVSPRVRPGQPGHPNQRQAAVSGQHHPAPAAARDQAAGQHARRHQGHDQGRLAPGGDRDHRVEGHRCIERRRPRGTQAFGDEGDGLD